MPDALWDRTKRVSAVVAPLSAQVIVGRAAVDASVLWSRRGQLTTEDVLLVAEGLAVSKRTVWRWIERARNNDDLDQVARDHFLVTDLPHQQRANLNHQTRPISADAL